MRSLSLAQARRVALQAQGLARPRRDRAPTMRDVQREITRVAQFQIDSVNVAVRAHYMPLFSRLGPYDTGLLDRAFGSPPRRLVEYWGHAACLIDVNLFNAMRFKMQREDDGAWISGIREGFPDITDQVLREVTEGGPLTARQIQHTEERSRVNWGWNWSSAKVALEWHFTRGRIASARRNAQFERVYDLPERVLPAHVLAEPPMDEQQQRTMLARRAANALGVFSERCLSEYFYTQRRPTRAAIDALVETGELEPVAVEGWKGPLWCVAGTTVPRRVGARALLSPFDSMMYQRQRIETLFDYHYRIEIYVPEPKRLYGYYVYSFLMDDEFVARVDLKADRQTATLLVQASWREPGRRAEFGEVAAALAHELATMAGWLGLSSVRVQPRGDLAPELASAVAAHGFGQRPVAN
ncbi:winged helix-turn-helix domain-containing protein [Aestuariimicrobium ganziense]|uniref:winged helix-turn-helix domain-containing protein n=1 Tax=Aestuariimicrobium ganziense TaxID=2773677 RepID=UPI002E2AED6E|nr:crosslink repair DNA glycosylase YcaQ family protein [Aestuariimicrobium ganziense]